MSTDTHPLDSPVWNALAGAHAAFGLGGPLALRYARGVTPLAAVSDFGERGYGALADLVEPGEAMGVFGQGEQVPSEWKILAAPPLIQMVCDEVVETPMPEFEQLGRDDVAAMVELAALTNPGPFGEHSWELGRYVGIRQNGTLIAMAGERLRFSGYTEVSAVCTRPGYRGRGYARALVYELSRSILVRGEVPFLHVRVDNVSGVSAYEAVGYRTRKMIDFKVISLKTRSPAD